MTPAPGFESLHQAHASELFAYLWRLFDGRPEAEDCLQETFLRALRAYPRLRSHRNLRAWLYRVATNTARTYFRHHAREQARTTDAGDHFADPGASPGERYKRKQMLVAVQHAIRTLPYKQRVALWMRKYQDLAYQEIALALDCSVGAARANVYQALARLRRIFANRVQEDSSRMTLQPDIDLDLSAWLGDRPRRHRPDPLLSALDDLYAASPDPRARRRVLGCLQRALSRHTPRRVYYDQLKRTPIGNLFFAVSEVGVLTVTFTSSEAGFLRQLRGRTGATPVRSRAHTRPVARQLREFFRGERDHFDLPLDLGQMSPFQSRVLLAAAQVRRGQVTTYGELARRIRRPGAARAVGQALARNPLPIILPCHRVLASDGSLGGYSAPGGLRIKARLLAMEGARLSTRT